MLSKFVNVGSRVDLTSIERVKYDNAEDNKKVYETKVYDILSDDRIEVLMPMEQSKLILLPVDSEYDVNVYEGKLLYQFDARIVDRYKSNNVYIIVLELTSNIRKIQRREFYRFSCALELKSRLCSHEDIEAFEMNRRFLFDTSALQRSVVVDISGGGLRFVANFRYDEGSTIYCSYKLPNNANDKDYEMLCTVLKVQELESRPGLFEHRIQYINIDEDSREDIIHFIFEEERKIRKKQT